MAIFDHFYKGLALLLVNFWNLIFDKKLPKNALYNEKISF